MEKGFWNRYKRINELKEQRSSSLFSKFIYLIGLACLSFVPWLIISVIVKNDLVSWLCTFAGLGSFTGMFLLVFAYFDSSKEFKLAEQKYASELNKP